MTGLAPCFRVADCLSFACLSSRRKFLFHAQSTTSMRIIRGWEGQTMQIAQNMPGLPLFSVCSCMGTEVVNWLSANDLATRYGCHPLTVDRLVREGRLPAAHKLLFGCRLWDPARLPEMPLPPRGARGGSQFRTKSRSSFRRNLRPGPPAVSRARLAQEKTPASVGSAGTGGVLDRCHRTTKVAEKQAPPASLFPMT